MTSSAWLWAGRWLRGSRRWILLALVAGGALLVIVSNVRASGCTNSWTGTAGDGLWSTGGNWSKGTVPTSGDVACIDAAGTFTVTLTGSAQVAELDVGGPSGTQTLAIAAACATNTTLTAGAGTVAANGTIKLTEIGNGCANTATLNMNNGATLTNAGTLISDPGDSGGPRQITGNLVNAGTGTLTVNQSIGIDNLANQAGGTVAVNANENLTVTSQTLNNAGQVTIADGAAVNATANSPTVTNSGTIAATGSGHINTAGATVNVAGGSITGTLPLALDTGTLNQQGGTISVVRMRNNVSLNGDIPAGETLLLAADCGANTTTTATSLTNHGTIKLTEIGNGCANTATLNMNNGATLTNAGTLISDPGDSGGSRQITGNLVNQGTVTINQQLDLGGNFTQSATGALAAGAARLNVVGSATLNGDVSLNVSPGPQSFVVLTAGSGRTGTFASANAVASPSDGTYYLPTYSDTTATLTLAAGSLAVSPSSGSRGSSVAVSGDGWAPSDSVTIGLADSAGTITRKAGIPTNGAGSFTTSITVPDRAAAGGALFWVESRFTGGSANRMSGKAFTVHVSAPIVTGLQPSSGPAAGGTVVTITGTDLDGATRVAFGQTPASSFSVDSNTQITATSPAGTGTVDVTVTTPSGTNSPGAADRFAYVQPPTPKPTVAPAPTVAPGTVSATTTQRAALAGSVNPHGSPTVAHFEYGLDTRYRPPGATSTVYDQATPDQSLGSGSDDVPVVTSVSGLVPNALYHVRLIAVNAAGTTRGPDQTFTTPADPAPPPPVPGQSENVKPAGGTIFVLSAGKLVPLTEARQLPSGSVLDTRRGTIALTAAAGAGKKAETGTFTGAVFRLTQTRGNRGLTTLTLLEGAFPGAPGYASCRAGGASDGAHAALSSRVLQTLRSRATGHFRTRGRYAAATVRGTQWTTTDRCDGTSIAVQVHSVLVTDFVKHVSVLVKAGHSYLARARPH